MWKVTIGDDLLGDVADHDFVHVAVLVENTIETQGTDVQDAVTEKRTPVGALPTHTQSVELI